MPDLRGLPKGLKAVLAERGVNVKGMRLQYSRRSTSPLSTVSLRAARGTAWYPTTTFVDQCPSSKRQRSSTAIRGFRGDGTEIEAFHGCPTQAAPRRIIYFGDSERTKSRQRKAIATAQEKWPVESLTSMWFKPAEATPVVVVDENTAAIAQLKDLVARSKSNTPQFVSDKGR